MAKLPIHLDDHVIDYLKSGNLPLLPVKLERSNLKYLSKQSLKLLIGGQNGVNNADGRVQNVPGLDSVSDLEPSKYEGGFKVWESTIDLLEMLYEDPNLVRGKTVLDIGCGAGLIGIASLLLGSSHVSFQDFNFEVLKWFTLPNIVLNLMSVDTSDDIDKTIEGLEHKVSLFYGDWSETPIPSNHFDVIITSETIYNQDNYSKLASLMDRCIKKEAGSVIVGAKTHYFGVGGGTRSFEEFMTSRTSLKSSSVIKVINSSVQREIIKFTVN